MNNIKFEKNEKMSKRELELLGSTVTQKECDMLGYSSLKSYTIIKDGENNTIYSSTTSPLYLITCKYWNGRNGESCFYVIFEPLSDQPNNRFRYYGAIPVDYIYGLFELEKAYKENNLTKLPKAIICYGHREAIAMLALGYFPIWAKSENGICAVENCNVLRFAHHIYIAPPRDILDEITYNRLITKCKVLIPFDKDIKVLYSCNHTLHPDEEIKAGDIVDLKSAKRAGRSMVVGRISEGDASADCYYITEGAVEVQVQNLPLVVLRRASEQ